VLPSDLTIARVFRQFLHREKVEQATPFRLSGRKAICITFLQERRNRSPVPAYRRATHLASTGRLGQGHQFFPSPLVGEGQGGGVKA
jgi:hypothetical protein